MELDNDLFDKEEERKKVLLIDTNNLCMRIIFAIPYDPTDITFVNYKTTLLKSIKKLAKDFSPNQIIFCQEGYDNWRREVYPEYKANRAEGRDNSYIDFDKFFPTNNEFFADISKVLENVQFLKISRLEADDLIALTVKNKKNWDITLVSTDRDFYQLHKYSNFKQWDPIKQKYIEVLNPETALIEKIITGDKGDNIPSIKKGVGPKTVAKILQKGLDEWLSMNMLKENFELNTKLISFESIPYKFNKIVTDELNNYKQKPFNSRELYNFIVKQGLGSMLDEMTEFSEIMKKVQ